VKLLFQLLTPAAVAALGYYSTRVLKRFEHFQWRNQRLIEKRIAIYDSIAPDLNDLLCYFTYVGCWKELAPPDVVALKRSIDKKIYLAAPIFSPRFLTVCNAFMDICYATFQDWGEDAKLRTESRRRRDTSGASWDASWDSCFSNNTSHPAQIQTAYKDVMLVFSNEIGIASTPQVVLGDHPTNVR